ncbi:CAAD domain-containing protein [Tolypothrix sp. FACHB-123]|uniref:CAAD domain-containing protein n=1 Tax=Tolypothrix sp. FACHB-123 TaxID=2692868 RepID=UPI00168307BA|nr:CAAD domain-containing protein [Tolypothrix sp. FACHB-123]MBD2357785.1 CAAD domain-containing protein [Tolypothrix sp. FACHB-123]
MATEQQQIELANSTSPEGTVALTGADNQNLPKLPPASQSNEQWQQIGSQVSDFLAKLPEYVSRFFNQYQQPLVTVFLILSAIVTLKVVLAILSAINGIPLIAPTFELIGIGYTAWFVYRYLIKAENRQELAQEIRNFQNQIVGS